MAKYDQVQRGLREILINNFLGGFSWAIGATVGLAIVAALLTFVFRNLNLIPFVGKFIAQITDQVLVNLQSQPHLIK